MDWMKSKYYCLTRFRFSHSLQINKEFFVGSPLYRVSKLLAFACSHKTTMNIGISKYLKLSHALVALLVISLNPVNAAGGLYGGGPSVNGFNSGAGGAGGAGIAVVITYF